MIIVANTNFIEHPIVPSYSILKHNDGNLKQYVCAIEIVTPDHVNMIKLFRSKWLVTPWTCVYDTYNNAIKMFIATIAT